MVKHSPIKDYIESAAPEAKPHLRVMRALVRKLAPKSEETLKWGMPTFVMSENLVHFAWHQKHLGFYPGSAAIAAFKKDFGAFTSSKGAVQFPYAEPIPVALVTKIVKFRIKAVSAKAASPKKGKLSKK